MCAETFGGCSQRTLWKAVENKPFSDMSAIKTEDSGLRIKHDEDNPTITTAYYRLTPHAANE